MDVDFKNLIDDDFERDMYEQQQDGWDDEEESLNDGLDPAFSSWADYYHYKYG